MGALGYNKWFTSEEDNKKEAEEVGFKLRKDGKWNKTNCAIVGGGLLSSVTHVPGISSLIGFSFPNLTWIFLFIMSLLGIHRFCKGGVAEGADKPQWKRWLFFAGPMIGIISILLFMGGKMGKIPFSDAFNHNGVLHVGQMGMFGLCAAGSDAVLNVDDFDKKDYAGTTREIIDKATDIADRGAEVAGRACEAVRDNKAVKAGVRYVSASADAFAETRVGR